MLFQVWMEVLTCRLRDPKYTLVCSYVGYKKCEVEIGNKDTEIVIPLKSDDVVLEGVTVIANNPGRTEAGARGIERAAMNVVNVMSAKAIELLRISQWQMLFSECLE